MIWSMMRLEMGVSMPDDSTTPSTNASAAPKPLGVARYPQNDPDDRTGHGSNRLGDNVEIEPYLRTNHWQDEKHPDQDHHPVGFQPGKWGSERFWKQSDRDPSTVEWR
jgi:hypothetical protein